MTKVSQSKIPPFGLRMQPHTHSRILEEAARNGRSMNAEITTRIEASLSGTSLPVSEELLRDRFAMAAVNAVAVDTLHTYSESRDPNVAKAMRTIARLAYLLADQMLEARKEPGKDKGECSALVAAERFISGFEGDETQEGITELLASIRAAIGGAQ